MVASPSPEPATGNEPPSSTPSIDPVPGARNNSPAWHPHDSVDPFTPTYREEHHDRLQPQGGRRFGSGQPNHRRSRRASGKRDSRIHKVSQRRGCPGGANALHQGPAHRLAKAYGVRRLHGAAAPPAQVAQSSSKSVGPPGHRASFASIAMLLILLFTILFLSGCGHPKQAHVSVPPPPPPASTTEPEGSRPAT